MSERFTAVLVEMVSLDQGWLADSRCQNKHIGYLILTIQWCFGVSYANVCDLSSLDCLEGANVIINLQLSTEMM